MSTAATDSPAEIDIVLLSANTGVDRLSQYNKRAKNLVLL